MCGRYATTVDPALLARELDAMDESGEFSPDYNVAPTTPILTVVAAEGKRSVRRMRWGFVAPWAEEFGAGPPLINARAESAATKPTFRDAVRSRRCLVPMDGWYEWRTTLDAAGKPVKTPLYMSARDGSTLLMAGVWSTWRGPGARSSCAVLTTESVGALRAVHDRMPLILPGAEVSRWLGAELDPAMLAPPAPEVADAVGVRRVSRLVNSVRNSGPQLLVPDEPEPEEPEPDEPGPVQLTLL